MAAAKLYLCTCAFVHFLFVHLCICALVSLCTQCAWLQFWLDPDETLEL